MFAFIAKDKNGDEGIPAWLDTKSGSWFPLVGADWARVDSLKALAKELTKGTDTKITLVEFSVRKDLETI